MITNCPVCGKAFEVLWPQKYRYKRMNRFLCSYGCMRAIDKGEASMKKKITDEMVREAVRIALEGGDVRMYLADCGSKNPSAHWAQIKKNMMKDDPETYEKLAKLPDKRKKSEIPEAPTVKLDGAIRIETPETNKVEVVETPERQIGRLCPPPEVEDDRLFHTAAVRNKKLGTFYYDDKHGTIDWRHPYGEEISLFPEDYRLLRDSIDMILHVLGVEL